MSTRVLVHTILASQTQVECPNPMAHADGQVHICTREDGHTSLNFSLLHLTFTQKSSNIEFGDVDYALVKRQAPEGLQQSQVIHSYCTTDEPATPLVETYRSSRPTFIDKVFKVDIICSQVWFREEQQVQRN